MAKTRLRILDGDIIEFYNSKNTVQTTFGKYASSTFFTDRIKLENNSNTGSVLEINCVNSSVYTGISLLDAGTEKWRIWKSSINDFEITGVSGNFLRIVNSNNHLILQADALGFVGVRCTPNYAFQVNTGTDQNLQVRPHVFGSNGILLACANDGDNANVGLELGALSIIFATNGSQKAIIDSNGLFGINCTPSSSWLMITNGTTSNSPLRFTSTSSVLLTSITADCWEYNGDTFFYTNKRTLRQAIPALIYATDTEAGPSASGTATSILDTGNNPTWKSLSFPANFFINGKTIKITAWGYYTTDVSGSSFQLTFSLGGTGLFASTGTFSPTLNQTRKFWKLELLLTCRNAGGTARFTTSGANYDVGWLEYDNSGVMAFTPFTITNGSNDSFDGTGTKPLDIKATISGTYTTAKFICMTATIETFA